LQGGAVAPAGGDAFGEERGELALPLVFISEIKAQRFAGFAVSQEGGGLAWIVVAVVIEEDDLSAQLGLETAGGLDFGEKETARENPQGCWPKQISGVI